MLKDIGGMAGEGLALSPDGLYVAFELHKADIAQNGYRVAWFIAETEQRRIARNVGDAGDARLFRAAGKGGAVNGAWISQKPVWSRDSKWIYYRRRINQEIEIWRSATDGNLQEQVTDIEGDVTEFSWALDGSKMFVEVEPRHADLRRHSKRDEQAGYLFDRNVRWSTFHGKPLKKYLASVDSESGPSVWVYDPATRVTRQASVLEILEYESLNKPETTPFDVSNDARGISQASNGTAIAWLMPCDPAEKGILPPLCLNAALQESGFRPIRCNSKVCSGRISLSRPLGGLWWSEDGEYVYFARREGHAKFTRTIYRWHVRSQQVKMIWSSDEWISDCAHAHGAAICFRQTPVYPRTIVSISLEDGVMRTLIDPNPNFGNLIIGKVSKFEWTSSLGHESIGYLVMPHRQHENSKLPLIVVGYRAKRAFRGGTGDEYPIHVFATNGFAVLVYERPEPWEVMATIKDGAELAIYEFGESLWGYRAPLSSFESAIKILDQKSVIDRSCVGITGFSNGALHARYALIHSNEFTAASLSGSTDNESHYFLSGSTSDFVENVMNRAGLGRPHGLHDTIRDHISFSRNPRKVHAALLFNVSDYEHLFALEDVITLMEENKAVEMYVYPGEFHVKWKPLHRLAVYERNVDWFRFWLQGVQAAGHSKVAQYKRWRDLRRKQNLGETKRYSCEGESR